MADEYTAEQIENGTNNARWYWRRAMPAIPEAEALAEFDSWLAARDRATREAALEEAAQIVNDTARQGGGLQTAEEAIRRAAVNQTGEKK